MIELEDFVWVSLTKDNYLNCSTIEPRPVHRSKKYIRYDLYPKWNEDINKAPKDGTPVLFKGISRPSLPLDGGKKIVKIFEWRAFESPDNGARKWITGSTSIDKLNVDFTHWMMIPE